MRQLLTLLLMVLAIAPLCAHDELDVQIALISEELTTNPRNVDAWLRRADLFRLRGELANARADLAVATMLNATTPGIELVRSRICADAGDLIAARAAVSRHLDAYPHDETALRARADIAERLDDRPAAIADLDKVIALAKAAEPEVWCHRARLLASIGKPEMALAELDDGLERLGAQPALADAAITIELAIGRTDSALTRLSALASTTGGLPWCVKQGELLASLKRWPSARAAFQRGLDSIAALPEERRSSVAMLDFERRCRNGLASLPEQP